MKILIVEDDPNKRRQITHFVGSEFAAWEVLERHSYQAGLKAALVECPDVLLLDMTMPTYDDSGQESSGRERRYAGEQILKYLQRKGIYCAAVVITQFERFGEGADEVTLVELGRRLKSAFGEMYRGSVFYQAAGTTWMSELKTLLTDIERSHSEGGDV